MKVIDVIRTMDAEELAGFINGDWCERVCGESSATCDRNCTRHTLEYLNSEVT